MVCSHPWVSVVLGYVGDTGEFGRPNIPFERRQMNMQLAQVISDGAGETGQKLVRAILAGERDGQALAKLKNVHIRASEEEIAKALQGNWRTNSSSPSSRRWRSTMLMPNRWPIATANWRRC